MKKFFSIIKEKTIHQELKKQHSEAYLRRISFLNKYSLLFHMLISCGIVFIVEVLFPERSFSLGRFLRREHTGAFFYNAFIVFASLSFCLSVPQTCILADHYQRFLGAPWNH